MKEEMCIFCKIISGEIPSTTLFEDELFKVIMDVSPASKGHCLIIPKEHFENLFDMPNSVGEKVLLLAKNVGKKIQEVTQCDGLNVVQNNGLAAGQTVFHFHMHLIPRYKGDTVSLGWEPGQLEDEIVVCMKEAFKNFQ